MFWSCILFMGAAFFICQSTVALIIALGEAVPRSKESSDAARSTSETKEQTLSKAQALRFKK